MARYKHKGRVTIDRFEKQKERTDWGTVAGVTFWIVIAGAVLAQCAG